MMDIVTTMLIVALLSSISINILSNNYRLVTFLEFLILIGWYSIFLFITVKIFI